MVRTGLAVAGAACLLVAGTVGSLTWGDQGERSSASPLPAVTEVRLDGTVGTVEVEHRPGARAEVREEVRGWWGGDEGPRHRVEGGTLVLPGCGSGCSVDYVIVLPAPVPVVGEGSAGSYIWRVSRVWRGRAALCDVMFSRLLACVAAGALALPALGVPTKTCTLKPLGHGKDDKDQVWSEFTIPKCTNA